MKEQILSYELTLPQRIYPHLDRLFSVFKNIAFRLTKPKAQRAEGIPGRFPSRLVQVEWKALLSFISFSKLLALLRIVETSQLKLKKLLKWVGSDKID